MRKHTQSKERGQALIIAALAMTALLGIVGLVTDVGLAYLEKAQMQKAVDAAALAGAQLLPNHPAAARLAAEDIAEANGLDPQDVAIDISTTSYPNDTISVSAEDDVPAYFTRVLNFVKFDIKVDSGSRTGSPSSLNEFIPLAVEQSVFAGLDTGDSALLKYDSQNQVTGNSLALALPGSDGADDFRQAVAQGADATLCIEGQEYDGCTSAVSTEPGQMAGPLRQGMSERFQATSDYCDSFQEVIASDPTDPTESIVKGDCQPFAPYNVTSSKRIVLVPVIDHLCNGRCDVRIVQFALFFVEDLQCTNGHGNGHGTCEVTGVYAERVSNVHQYSKLGPYNSDAAFTIGALTQ